MSDDVDMETELPAVKVFPKSSKSTKSAVGETQVSEEVVCWLFSSGPQARPTGGTGGCPSHAVS